MIHIRRVIFLPLAIALSSASYAQDQDKAPGDSENRVEQAVVEAVDEAAEKTAREQARFERQLVICREAMEGDNWVAYVDVAISYEPELGPRADHIRICMAYLNGRRDQLLEERKRLLRQ